MNNHDQQSTNQSTQQHTRPIWPPPSTEHNLASSVVNHALLNRVTNKPLFGASAKQQTIGEYISNKRVKVAHQYRTEATGLPQILAQSANAQSNSFVDQSDKHVVNHEQWSSTSSPTSIIHNHVIIDVGRHQTILPTPLLTNIVCWINGLTTPPMHELRAMIYQHGGEIENVLIPRVTHIIANNLPSSKIAEFKGTQRHKRVIVQAAWIVDSIAAQRLLPVAQYVPMELRDMTSQPMYRWMSNPSAPVLSTVPDADTHVSTRKLYPVNQPVNQSVHQPPGQLINQQSEQLINQSIDRSVNNSDKISQSVAAVHNGADNGSVLMKQAGSHVGSGIGIELETAPIISKPLSFRTMLFKKPAPVITKPPPVPVLLPPPRDLRGNLVSTAYSDHVRSILSVTTDGEPKPVDAPSLIITDHSLLDQVALVDKILPQPSYNDAVVDSAKTKVITDHSSGLPAPTVLSCNISQAEEGHMTPTSFSPGPHSVVETVSDPSVTSAKPSRLLPLSMLNLASSTHQSARSTLNDPHFVSTFFAASRLSFIGSWKRLFQHLIPDLLKIKPRYTINQYVRAAGRSRWILHADLDCFFASVTIRDNPSLKGKPVAVSHSVHQDESSTSSISSCNYEARAFGLKADMLIGYAHSLCPNLIVVPYEFEKYATASEAVYRQLFSISHMIQAVSLDEALIELPSFLEERDVLMICEEIRENVKSSVGIPISIGIGSSRLIARLATRKAKPDGIAYIDDDPSALLSVMSTMKVSDLPGVGRKLSAKLVEDLKVTTCGELQKIPRDRLQALFGEKTGVTLHSTCRGIDERPLEYVGSDPTSNQQSLAVNVNYGIRFHEVSQVRLFLTDLCNELHTRLVTTTSLACQSIALRLMVRQPDAPIEPLKFLGHGKCDARSKSKQIEGGAIGDSNAITDTDARKLFKSTWDLFEKLRSEFSIEISDIRGVALTAGKLKKRGPLVDRGSNLAAFGFAPVSTMILSDDDNDSEVDDITEVSKHDENHSIQSKVPIQNDLFHTDTSTASNTDTNPSSMHNMIDIPVRLGQQLSSDTTTVAVPVDDLIKLLASHGLTLQRQPAVIQTAAQFSVQTSESRLKSIDETVAEVDAQKERELMDILPPFELLDRSVIAELPLDVRNELATVYKKKRAMPSNQHQLDKQTMHAHTKILPSISESVIERSRSPPVLQSSRSYATNSDLSMSVTGRSSKPAAAKVISATTLPERAATRPVYEIVPRTELSNRPNVAEDDGLSVSPTRPAHNNPASSSRTTISLLTPVSQASQKLVIPLVPPPRISSQINTPAADTMFLSLADIQPEFSIWLRSLKAACRHRHDVTAQLPECCDHVGGQDCQCSSFCFCSRSSNAATVMTLCRTQLQLRNLELVGHIVNAIRRVINTQEESSDYLSQSQCVCFDCNCWSVLSCIDKDIQKRYRAHLIVSEI